MSILENVSPVPCVNHDTVDEVQIVTQITPRCSALSLAFGGGG